MKQKEKQEDFYVVGVGASAGGLEALQDYFKNIPDDTGAAYVVIQHLSPDYKSLMDELLSRCTGMPVKVVQDGMDVRKNHVYLIPPKKELKISNRRLHLSDQPHETRINLAIDTFFKSLAEDCGKYAIAVVLSGAGSDGTLGIRYIKESGGMIMVQDPHSAAFNSMPLSAIATGLVDYVLEPDAMGAAMISYIEHPFSKEKRIGEQRSEDEVFQEILNILQAKNGIDFTNYKEQTIRRRLERRASISQFNSLEEYFGFFSSSPREKESLFKEFLIGVTGFFRDKEAFEYLAQQVLPSITPQNGGYRIWSVACSTGEEAYTLAMLLSEHMEKNHIAADVKIFATDIDKSALATASQGVYAESVASDIPPEYLTKYFNKTEGGYKVISKLRKMIIFSSHDVLTDPPFSRLDLLVCRNLFIYLKPGSQQNLLYRFYYSLNEYGYLFMGNSESIGEMSDAFQARSRKYKIYQKKDMAGELPFMGTRINRTNGSYTVRSYQNDGKIEGRSVQVDKIIEQAFGAVAPSSIVVNDSDSIIYMGRDMNKILQYRQGLFSQNVFSNLPHGLGIFVNGILRKLKSGEMEASTICAAGLPQFPNENMMITGYRLTVNKSPFFLLTFEQRGISERDEEVLEKDGTQIGISERITDLEEELQITKENLQSTIEELETANEELQSTNEELVAANEELQSTNEELQSVNEELYTVNSEYQSKIDEMTRINADMDNLLNNVEVGALYLDSQFCIRKITPMIPKITHIMDVDVGRPISHLFLMDTYPNWQEDVKNVYQTLQPLDREISEPGGRYWLVRIRPYRTEYNSIEGVIMTFVEATELRMMKNSTFANAGLLYWQRENCEVIRWRYNVDNCVCTVFKPDGLEAEKEIVITPEEFFSRLHPDDERHIRSALREMMETERKSCELTCRFQEQILGMETGWMYIQVYKIEQGELSEVRVLQGGATSLESRENTAKNDNL